MASLHLDPRTGKYLVSFRVRQGATKRQYHRSCETTNLDDARTVQRRIEKAIELLEEGWIPYPPPEINRGDWVFNQAKNLASTDPHAPSQLPPPPEPPVTDKPKPSRSATLAEAFEGYFEARIDKSKGTINDERLHSRHWMRLLDADRELDQITLADLREAVGKRLTEPARPKRVKPAKAIKPASRKRRAKRAAQKAPQAPGPKVKVPVKTVDRDTVGKMILTLTQVWAWAQLEGLVQKTCPLVNPDVIARRQGKKWLIPLPPKDDKYDFMTWDECARRASRFPAGHPEIADIWENAYLTEPQAEELLAYIKQHATAPFVYAAVALAYYAGARRGEIPRIEIDDVDLDPSHPIITLRQTKHRRGMGVTLRDVPIHGRLHAILQDVLKTHPGGRYLLTYVRKRSRRNTPSEYKVTGDLLSRELRDSLASGKWATMPGYHALRHTFGAVCALRGVPSRTAGEWMGHVDKKMWRVYQHLYPEESQRWMQVITSTASTLAAAGPAGPADAEGPPSA